MPRLNIALDIHNATPEEDHPYTVADDLLAFDLPRFSPGATFALGGREGEFVAATWGPPETWAIDPSGRVYFEGRWVFTVARRPDLDGPLTTRFTVEGVWVTEDPEADDPIDVFDSGVSGVGGKAAISSKTWEAVNASRGS